MSDQPEPSAFGRLVKRLRLARGWSQSRLATEAGLSDSYLSLIETGGRGARPSPRTLAGLAQALECDSVELFEAAGRPMPLTDIEQLQADLARQPEVIRAIQRDPLLRSPEREALTKLYRSYLDSR